MDPEASPFESSEMLASLLASTPLLSESWSVCVDATNATHYGGFATKRIGEVGYFAFSACTQMTDYFSGNLVPLESCSDGLFSVLTKKGNNIDHNNVEEEVVMVHPGLLNLFLSLRGTQAFQDQMLALIKECKSIVITGHSIGGAAASLCALWLLSYLQSAPCALSVLCITFGSPLLGNQSFSRAILRERWGGSFCHVVSKYDIMPRLLFAPLEICNRYLYLLGELPVLPLGEKERADELFGFIAHYNLQVSSIAQPDSGDDKASGLYWPFGNYLFCSQEGAICVENAASVIKMMYLTFVTGNPSCCITEHLKYGDYVVKICSQFVSKKSFLQGVEEFPESSYEAGIALAVLSSGISTKEVAGRPAEDCLKIARRTGHTRTPSLNAANLAISLSKVTPYRAQIEWYKVTCDKSDKQLGYYDSFKLRGSSKRDNKINMNRLLLAGFWNDVLHMLEKNELPLDFHKRSKWVMASHFYKLLVEPLEIADYYRSAKHQKKGHYLKHGRERRFEIFDRWYGERDVSLSQEENTNTRSKYAGLTQDSCFWAKVEEAKEWLASVRSEPDVRNMHSLWAKIIKFERYATGLVDRKEVSADVLAKHSSYMSWVEELTTLKSQMQQQSVLSL